MIKKIWQICASRGSLPDQYRYGRQTWEDLNTEWTIELVTNEESRQLFVEYFPEYLTLFDELPMGVMKADLWRYAVMYLFGGVYADVDTECIESISTWYPEDGNLHVSYEIGTGYICQWVFAAPAKHEALKFVMDLVKNRIENDHGIDFHRHECVHYYTGPDVFTAGILQYMGWIFSQQEIASEPNVANIAFHRDGFFHTGPVRHGFASFEWGGKSYNSWRDELEQKRVDGKKIRAKEFKRLVIPRTMHDLHRFGPIGDGAFILSRMALHKSSYVISLGNDPLFDYSMMNEGKRMTLLNLDESTREAFSEALSHVDLPFTTIKMDVEGREYDLIEESIGMLSVVPQIAIEIHGFLDGDETCWQRRIGLLETLLSSHFVAHLHGNNHGGVTHGIPDVIEILFIRRADFESFAEKAVCPCPRLDLDFPNKCGAKDLEFGWWCG